MRRSTVTVLVMASLLVVGMALIAAPAAAGEESAEFYWKRGVAYSEKGQRDQAFADINKALEIDPKFAKAYNSRGIFYAEKGQHDQAIAEYTRALEIDPKFAKAYYNRGNSYAEKGQHDQAISDYNKSIELDNNSRFYHNRGIIFYEQSKFDKSIVDFSKAIELDPNDYQAYCSLFLSYYYSNNHEKAFKIYPKIQELYDRLDSKNDKLKRLYQNITKLHEPMKEKEEHIINLKSGKVKISNIEDAILVLNPSRDMKYTDGLPIDGLTSTGQYYIWNGTLSWKSGNIYYCLDNILGKTRCFGFTNIIVRINEMRENSHVTVVGKLTGTSEISLVNKLSGYKENKTVAILTDCYVF